PPPPFPYTTLFRSLRTETAATATAAAIARLQATFRPVIRADLREKPKPDPRLRLSRNPGRAPGMASHTRTPPARRSSRWGCRPQGQSPARVAEGPLSLRP